MLTKIVFRMQVTKNASCTLMMSSPIAIKATCKDVETAFTINARFDTI